MRRQVHLNKLVCTAGVVTRRTGVFPQLQQIKFDCGRCGYVLGPFFQNTGEAEVKPNTCPQCQAKGPFSVRRAPTALIALCFPAPGVLEPYMKTVQCKWALCSAVSASQSGSSTIASR